MSFDSAGQITISFMSGPFDGKWLAWDYPNEGRDLIVTIGRRETCDIILNYDSQVSRLHARVTYDIAAETFYLEDSGSRNGTFVNGERITERVQLRPGTMFRIGRTWLRLDPWHAAPEKVDEDTDNTHF